MCFSSCTPKEVRQHLQPCGAVNRVTIRTDKYGQAEGHAYVEFLEPEAVHEVLLLNESELRGCQLKVNHFPSPFFFRFNFSFKNYMAVQIYLGGLLNLFYLQVTAKRTNGPGMKQFQPRQPNPYMFRGPCMPAYYSPYGYGYASKYPILLLLLFSTHSL